jgi:hypothetical protein
MRGIELASPKPCDTRVLSPQLMPGHVTGVRLFGHNANSPAGREALRRSFDGAAGSALSHIQAHYALSIKAAAAGRGGPTMSGHLAQHSEIKLATSWLDALAALLGQGRSAFFTFSFRVGRLLRTGQLTLGSLDGERKSDPDYVFAEYIAGPLGSSSMARDHDGAHERGKRPRELEASGVTTGAAPTEYTRSARATGSYHSERGGACRGGAASSSGRRGAPRGGRGGARAARTNSSNTGRAEGSSSSSSAREARESAERQQTGDEGASSANYQDTSARLTIKAIRLSGMGTDMEDVEIRADEQTLEARWAWPAAAAPRRFAIIDGLRQRAARAEAAGGTGPAAQRPTYARQAEGGAVRRCRTRAEGQ